MVVDVGPFECLNVETVAPTDISRQLIDLCFSVQTKVMGGIKMSYRLQELLQQQQLSTAASSGPAGSCLLRGVRLEESNFVSLNSYVYSLIRGNRGQRRALLSSALKMFDETAVSHLTCVTRVHRFSVESFIWWFFFSVICPQFLGIGEFLGIGVDVFVENTVE